MQRGGWAAAVAMVVGVWLTGCPDSSYRPRASPAPPAPSAPSAPAASATDAAPDASASPAGSSWSVLPSSVRPSEAEMMAALGASSVLASQFERRVLYTWTSEEQGQKLRADRLLLVKDSNDGPGMSQFETSLWESYALDPWARVLMNPPFHRVRYAWTNPWATRLNPDDHPYGDVLVRVELKPEAIVASYTRGRPLGSRWSFHGLDGRVFTSAQAMAAAGRIGAIYHVHVEGYSGLREYIVCNESMVASWSVASDEVKAAIASDQRLLDQLARFTRGRTGWGEGLALEQLRDWQSETEQTWLATSRPTTVEAAYAASLAFAIPQFQPAEHSLLRLESEMREAATKLAEQGPALVHRPTAPPIGRVTVPAPVFRRPRPPCIPRGSIGCYEPESLPCRDDSGKIVPCKT